MCSAAALPKFINDVQSDVCQFSIGSKWLYEADSRFDAAAYSEGAFRAREEIETCGYPTESLGQLCGTIWHPVQNQARSNFKRIYTKPEHGVPFVSSRNMFFLPLRPEKFLSRRMKKLGDLMIPRGWIIVSRSGTVGNILLVNKTLEKCAITDHTIRLEPVGVPSGYLYAFLASRFGKAFISSSTYGSTVDELEPKHLVPIPVPLPSEDIQKSIHRKILQAYALRDRANQIFDKAEQDLYKSLGINSFSEDDVQYLGSEDDPQAFEISSSELVDRLDASHHVPIVRSVLHKLSQSKFKLIQLGSKVNQVYVAPRFARIYVEEEFGTPLLQGSQLLSMRPYDLKYISNAKTKKMERWLIQSGWVLVTCSGTIGRIAVSSSQQNGWAASQHILRIIPKENSTHPGFLSAFLSTPYGQHQLKAKIYGGVIDELTAEDTEVILIPDIPYPEQLKIGEPILKVYELRDKANNIENEAIAELEAMISG
jgi:type I restriction enzyme, S subunit